AREAHNLEVTGSNPVPATFFTPAGPSMAPAGCFFAPAPGLLPGSFAVCRIHGPGELFLRTLRRIVFQASRSERNENL
ncbi:MAG: hypothetical protein WCH79_17075, partial [Planctomycetia bacterium]